MDDKLATSTQLAIEERVERVKNGLLVLVKVMDDGCYEATRGRESIHDQVELESLRDAIREAYENACDVALDHKGKG